MTIDDNHNKPNQPNLGQYGEILHQYGWICPKCGRVNSPYIVSCLCCTQGGVTQPPWWPPYVVTCNKE